jgi:protein tyrosine phosphatase (PTP) superfamily phosphohydrolase (DUF442 family)
VPGEASRAAQAWGGFLAPFLRGRGIKAMINLRGPNPNYAWWREERAACEAAGAAHRDVTLDSRHLPTRAQLDALFDAFDTAPKPFLVKCSGGQDRTSLASALYILHRDGWDAREAAANQFARWPYLHFPKPEQRWLKEFVRFAADDAAGEPIAQWARTRYAPERLRDWLTARGLGDSFRGIFEKAAPAHPRQW